MPPVAPSRRQVLFAPLLLSTGALADESASSRDTPGGRRYNLPYSGGGIRGAGVAAPDGWLVSPSEAMEHGGEAGYGEPPLPRTRSLVPRLELLQPRVPSGERLRSPFVLELRFGGPGQAPVDPAAFRALYGARRLDITQRLIAAGELSDQGLRVPALHLPPGRHRLLFQLGDVQLRTSEVDLRVEIE